MTTLGIHTTSNTSPGIQTGLQPAAWLFMLFSFSTGDCWTATRAVEPEMMRLKELDKSSELDKISSMGVLKALLTNFQVVFDGFVPLTG